MAPRCYPVIQGVRFGPVWRIKTGIYHPTAIIIPIMDKALLCVGAILVATVAAGAGSLRRHVQVTDAAVDPAVATASVATAAAYAAPANDLFSRRAALAVGTAWTRGSLLLASAELGEPSPSIYAVQASIWYEWSSTVTGQARVAVLYASSNVSEVRVHGISGARLLAARMRADGPWAVILCCTRYTWECIRTTTRH